MAEEKKKDEALETYHKVADTVGLVPNVRGKDNLIQGAVVGIGTIITTVVGWFMDGGQGAGIGALIGLVGFGLLSGLVLMVLGWIRAAK